MSDNADLRCLLLFKLVQSLNSNFPFLSIEKSKAILVKVYGMGASYLCLYSTEVWWWIGVIVVLQNLNNPSLLIAFVQVCLQNIKTLKILHLGLEICPFWALYYLAQEFRKAHAASACLSHLKGSQMFVRVLIKCCAEPKFRKLHIFGKTIMSVLLYWLNVAHFCARGEWQPAPVHPWR